MTVKRKRIRRSIPLLDRFWPRVDKNGPKQSHMKTRCWEWTGCTSNGYGTIEFTQDGLHTMLYAHRVAWESKYGPIPDKKCLLHRCDFRKCVRPSHLFPGTKKQNTEDMFKKGRDRAVNPQYGEKNGSAKLTWKLVRKARRLFARGNITNKDLAKMFGVAQRTMYDIITNQHWRE